MKNAIAAGAYLAVAFIGLHLGRLLIASLNLPNDGDPPLGGGNPLGPAQYAGSGRASAVPPARVGPVRFQGAR
jgi:hypothetical protein